MHKLLFASIALIAAPLAAQAGSGPADTMKRMDACWTERDLDCLGSYLLDDVVYTNALGSVWRSKAEARKGWGELLRSPYAAFPTIESREERFFGPDIAVVTERGAISGMRGPGGKEMPSISTLATVVMVKRSGRWMVAAGHSSSPPPLPSP